MGYMLYTKPISYIAAYKVVYMYKQTILCVGLKEFPFLKNCNIIRFAFWFHMVYIGNYVTLNM